MSNRNGHIWESTIHIDFTASLHRLARARTARHLSLTTLILKALTYAAPEDLGKHLAHVRHVGGKLVFAKKILLILHIGVRDADFEKVIRSISVPITEGTNTDLMVIPLHDLVYLFRSDSLVGLLVVSLKLGITNSGYNNDRISTRGLFLRFHIYLVCEILL